MSVVGRGSRDADLPRHGHSHLLLRGRPPFQARAAARLAGLSAAGDQVAVSELSRLECRVKPIRLGDAAVLAIYDGFFGRPDVTLVPITAAVFDRATMIRAARNFSLADSLHLATAVAGGCDRFLTNDHRLAGFPDIAVEVLP
jgi:predicted nucleic acid-binding protein